MSDRSGPEIVHVLDYGIGNVSSVLNMLEHLGMRGEATADPALTAASATLILPGVGAFDAGMRALADRGLVEPLREAASAGRRILGICLGAQMLLDESEEGSARGLGIVPGRARAFDASASLPVPHMGWNVVHPAAGTQLFRDVRDEQRFYFTHSYHMELDRPEDVAATASYGVEFASAFEAGSIAGVQFHPEKSHRFGMALFERFLGTRC
jgi:glutamine amidotransferase